MTAPGWQNCTSLLVCTTYIYMLILPLYVYVQCGPWMMALCCCSLGPSESVQSGLHVLNMQTPPCTFSGCLTHAGAQSFLCTLQVKCEALSILQYRLRHKVVPCKAARLVLMLTQLQIKDLASRLQLNDFQSMDIVATQYLPAAQAGLMLTQVCASQQPSIGLTAT